MTSFEQAARLHELSEDWEADRILVEHPLLEAFSRAISELLGDLGEKGAEEYWVDLLRPLRRLRWSLANVPLPIGHSHLEVKVTANRILPELRRVAEVDPAFAVNAGLIEQLLDELLQCSDNPLGDEVTGLLDASGVSCESQDSQEELALLIRSGSDADAVSRALGLEYSVLTPTELMRGPARTVVVAVGPVSWFPPAILRAPRAERFFFVYFSWLRDHDPELGLLTGAAPREEHRLRQPSERSPEAIASSRGLLVDARDWVPRVEWKDALAREPNTDGSGTPVPARLFALASGEGVFLDVRDEARVYVAEIEDEVSVRQQPSSELSRGQYVVLRTTGEGDYIRELADGLLGGRSAYLRATQQEWKKGLQEVVSQLGMDQVVRSLTQHGAGIASEANVHRWIYDDGLKTNRREDFRAIIDLIGQSERFDEIWGAMAELDSAHRKAGNLVRRLLIEEIKASDGAELLRHGWADFDVEEIQGEGTLRVARIEDIAPNREEVLPSRIRRLFPFEAS